VGTTKLYNIYHGNWNNNGYSNTNTIDIITQFTTGVGQSSWYRILTTYWDYTGGTPIDSVFIGNYFVNTAGYPTILDDSYVRNTILLVNMVNGIIPVPDSHNCYNIFSSDDTISSADCTSICGYHSSAYMNVNGINYYIKYTVIANQAQRNTMSSKCQCTWWGGGQTNDNSPNANYVADSFVYMLSHEIAEAVVAGWNSGSSSSENADKCSWRSGAGSTGDFLYYKFTNSKGLAAQANLQIGSRYYHVTSNWVNVGYGCCTVSYPLDYSHGEQYICGQGF
jgi:hypothetical protein